MTERVPEFASNFIPVVLAAHDELAKAREVAEPDADVAVWKRATSPRHGLAAILVLGTPGAIDRYMQENDLR